ncbi:MAG: flippase-like domain-containing protein [Lewinellaceae bacterium]|nr:flippase-like domain-containing protein [Lewinellaceae bacterium]
MKHSTLEHFDEEHQEALKSIRVSRIILPVLLGIVAVGYLLWRQFDPQEFAQINWTAHTLFWIIACVLILVIRHLAYATRLHILSEGEFTWSKCIELIFIWEFSSAVSPTAVGGSAVAFFVLAQEKLSTAKTATIVLYTIVLDSFFFIGTLPILFLFFGTHMIRPEVKTIDDIGAWGFYFLFAYSLMALYSSIFYYGLFINPKQMKRVLVSFTRVRFLKRYRRRAIELGNEMILASTHLKQQNWKFHLGAFLSTATAWSCRFLLLNCLIIAFITKIPLDFWTQFELYSRLETMFVIIAFSPTPGGAGFVEILFGGFLSDYVSNPTYATLISTIWRLLSYYTYLLAGAIVIPNWIREILNQRRLLRQEMLEAEELAE